MSSDPNADDAPPPERPIPTLSHQDELLRDCLIDDLVAQSTRLDELARQLITVELAVPGLYVTVLRLVAGEKARIVADHQTRIPML
ncbi:hypothetical protein [uncultured Thiodictyon sp.]|uniref:hypothetical protein n=1 Tax=uncultured Thiodictyon sp. TaxID=1846217 RepID=UPI0025DA6945|nr:hypothetical protein [uncultured Thiodictyon sp.]